MLLLLALLRAGGSSHTRDASKPAESCPPPEHQAVSFSKEMLSANSLNSTFYHFLLLKNVPSPSCPSILLCLLSLLSL